MCLFSEHRLHLFIMLSYGMLLKKKVINIIALLRFGVKGISIKQKSSSSCFGLILIPFTTNTTYFMPFTSECPWFRSTTCSPFTYFFLIVSENGSKGIFNFVVNVAVAWGKSFLDNSLFTALILV